MAALNRNANGRGIFRQYATYSFRAREQDPVIDAMKTLLNDELGMQKGVFQQVHERTGLSTSTLRHWFVSCRTQMPRYASIAAFARGLGYDVALVKTAKRNSAEWTATGPTILNRRK